MGFGTAITGAIIRVAIIMVLVFMFEIMAFKITAGAKPDQPNRFDTKILIKTNQTGNCL
jgi:hypothetical protein